MSSVDRVIHPIELESYRRLRARLDTSHFPPLTRAVVERVVHSAADLDYASDLVLDEGELATAHRALHAGAPVVVDVQMVAANHPARHRVLTPGRQVRSRTDPFGTRDPARLRRGRARRPLGDRQRADRPGGAAAAGRLSRARHRAARRLRRRGRVKAALRESGLPAVSNVSEKGGSAVASAALNALLYHPVSHPEEKS